MHARPKLPCVVDGKARLCPTTGPEITSVPSIRSVFPGDIENPQNLDESEQQLEQDAEDAEGSSRFVLTSSVIRLIKLDEPFLIAARPIEYCLHSPSTIYVRQCYQIIALELCLSARPQFVAQTKILYTCGSHLIGRR